MTAPGTPDMADFDGCHSACRYKGVHTLVWGGCEHAVRPEPVVSLSHVYVDTDGRTSVGFDTYTVAQLAALIEPALRRAGELPSYTDLAREAAHAIMHRHDGESPAVSRAPEGPGNTPGRLSRG